MWVKLPSGAIEMVHGSINMSYGTEALKWKEKDMDCIFLFRAGISNHMYMACFPKIFGKILCNTIKRSHFEDYRTVSVLNVIAMEEIEEANYRGFLRESEFAWESKE